MASVCQSLCFWMPGAELGEAIKPKPGTPLDSFNAPYGGGGMGGGNQAYAPVGNYGAPSNMNNRGGSSYTPGGGGGYQPGLY